MRADAIGLWWQDIPKPPPPVRTPPPRTWEEPGYLPRLDEALAFAPDFTDEELQLAQAAREPLAFDIEVYPNYFLAAFRSLVSGKVTYVETTTTLEAADCIRLRWLLENFLIVTFNGNYFDLPITALALAGRDCGQLKEAVDKIIVEQMQPWMLLRGQRVKPLTVDTVDLIKVVPLSPSLKLCAARLHAQRLQELPFPPGRVLDDNQRAIVRLYCCKFDLTHTGMLWRELQAQIELRRQMGPLYNLDLRSKSDSQMAEALVCAQIEAMNGFKPTKPEISPGTVFRYKVPAYISYQTPTMREALATVAGADFIVQENGGIDTPIALKDLTIKLGAASYTMGIGGLHSNETTVAHWEDEDTLLIDRDVASYYPAVILNLGLYPSHIGPNFLKVYRTIVERRLAAKKSGNKVEADSLKIAVNGTFGKLGSKYSPLYAPDLMIQVTITGQLSLLMLIETLEEAGIQVCSANTDGLLISCPRSRKAEVHAAVAQWERTTGFNTEESLLRFLCARDVNNYIAVKQDGSVKVKGTYSERGSAGDSVLSKNPDCQICNDAVIAWLKDGVPVEQTIADCADIRRFLMVQSVTGGGVKDGVYLGKVVRWYYAVGTTGEIVYAKNGNKVPDSDGACPVPDLPEVLPHDIDRARYVAIAYSILQDIGVMEKPVDKVTTIVQFGTSS